MEEIGNSKQVLQESRELIKEAPLTGAKEHIDGLDMMPIIEGIKGILQLLSNQSTPFRETQSQIQDMRSRYTRAKDGFDLVADGSEDSDALAMIEGADTMAAKSLEAKKELDKQYALGVEVGLMLLDVQDRAEEAQLLTDTARDNLREIGELQPTVLEQSERFGTIL